MKTQGKALKHQDSLNCVHSTPLSPPTRQPLMVCGYWSSYTSTNIAEISPHWKPTWEFSLLSVIIATVQANKLQFVKLLRLEEAPDAK